MSQLTRILHDLDQGNISVDEAEKRIKVPVIEKEIIDHLKSLIKLYGDLSRLERDRKNLNSPRISVSKTAREICNTASVRIKAYDDFILHLKGCITILKPKL